MSSENGSSPTAAASEAIIRKKSVNPTANFASNLSSVPEEETSLLLNDSNKPNPELLEVVKVEHLEVPTDEADVAGGVRRHSFKRHSNAFRRKSSFSARFSKLRKYSFSRQRSQEQSENNEQVVLRKDV